jgi:hypothetical protein
MKTKSIKLWLPISLLANFIGFLLISYSSFYLGAILSLTIHLSPLVPTSSVFEDAIRLHPSAQNLLYSIRYLELIGGSLLVIACLIVLGRILKRIKRKGKAISLTVLFLESFPLVFSFSYLVWLSLSPDLLPYILAFCVIVIGYFGGLVALVLEPKSKEIPDTKPSAEK